MLSRLAEPSTISTSNISRILSDLDPQRRNTPIKLVQSIAAAVVITLGLAWEANAGALIMHQGNTDPTTENFGLWPFNGGITTSSLANDLGMAAWQIANTGSTNEQAFYNQLGGTGPYDPAGSGLTQAEINAINAQGFTMSLQARIVQGPTYDPSGTGFFSVDITVAGFNSSRYDIELGSDGKGNTLVILPSATSFNGDNFSSTPFGSPLLVTGNGYHLYQLSYDPTTGQAALFVDGVERLSDYPGTAVSGGATANNYGLAFGTVNNATGNFALASLSVGQLSVPEPGTFILLGVGVGSVAGYTSRKRRGAKDERLRVKCVMTTRVVGRPATDGRRLGE
jgi:hypothetical protein